MAAKIYSNEDVQQILQQAVLISQEDGISRQQLFEIATELGLSVEILQQAEQSWLSQRVDVQKRTRQRARQRFGFQLHFIPYLFVSTLLVIINLSSTPGYFWSIYPILGWGLGVAIHGACVYRKTP